MPLSQYYINHAWFRRMVRIVFWGAAAWYFTFRIGQPITAWSQPAVLAFVVRNTLLALLFCYMTANWFIPVVLPRRYGLGLLALWLIGWLLLDGLSVVGTYWFVFHFLPVPEPLLTAWKAGYAGYLKKGYFTFVLDRLLLGYVFYRYLSYLFILALKLIKDSLVTIYEESVLQKRSLDLELSYLKSRINPTFLFHTLGNIEALAEQQDVDQEERAPEIILKLSDMMRYMLYETNVDWVPLTKEVEFINKYVELEQMRLEGSVAVTYQLLGQHLEQQRIPPLLLFSFVERAFLNGRSYVHLSLEVSASRLALMIEADQQTEYHSSSLDNARKRLILLYSTQADLTIDERPNLFKLQLVIRNDHNRAGAGSLLSSLNPKPETANV